MHLNREVVTLIVLVAIGVAVYFYLRDQVLCDFSITGDNFRVCVEGPK